MKERWRIRERNHARTHTLHNVNNFRHQFRTAKEFSMIDDGNKQPSSHSFTIERVPFLQSIFRQCFTIKCHFLTVYILYKTIQLNDR